MMRRMAWRPVIAIATALILLSGVGIASAVESTVPNKPVDLASPSRLSGSPAETAIDADPVASSEGALQGHAGRPTPPGNDERLHSEVFADEAPPSGLALKEEAEDAEARSRSGSSAFAKEDRPIRPKSSDGSLWTGMRSSVGADKAGGYLQGLISMVIVLGLIGFVAYGARRWLPGVRRLRATGLEILGQTHLSPKQSIALVRMGRHLVMIGVTPERISRLADVDDPREVAEILVQLKTGESLRPSESFGSALDEAEDVFAGGAMDADGTGTLRSRADELQATRGQVQSLLRRVRLMTGKKRAG